jgi:hypothetical protein
MRADAARGGWEAILCWDEARFGRWHPLRVGKYISEFLDHRRYVVCVKDGKTVDWESDTGGIVYTIEQHGRHKENKDRAANAARGMKDMVELGNWPASLAPWGYSVYALPVPPRERKGRKWRWLSPVPGLVRWVRFVFEKWAREGWAKYAIARHLTANGVAAPKGGGWTSNTLRDVLENPAYLGRTVYCRETRGKYWRLTVAGVKAPAAKPLTGRNQKGRHPPKRNDPAEVITRDGTHDRLIDDETWRLAQERTREDRERGARTGAGKAREAYLFTSLVRCACGEKMHAHLLYRSRRVRCECGGVTHVRPRPDSPPARCKRCGAALAAKPGTPTVSYVCAGWQSRGSCMSRRVKEVDLKRAVVDQVLGGVLNRPDLRDEITQRVMAQVAAGPDEAKQLRRQAADLEAKLKLASERFLVCPPEATAAAAEAIARWKGELDVAKDRLANLTEAAVSVKDAKRTVRLTLEAVDALRAHLRVAAPAGKATKKRTLLAALYRRLLKRVDVVFEGNTPTAVNVTLNTVAFELRHLATHLEPVLAQLRADIEEDIAFQAEQAAAFQAERTAPKTRDGVPSRRVRRRWG